MVTLEQATPKRVAKLYRELGTMRAVADKVGISAATVYRDLRDLGVRSGKKGRRRGTKLKVNTGPVTMPAHRGLKRGRKAIFTPAQKRVLARMIRKALKAELRSIARSL